ncbi:hypothetical protein [Blastococcus sp. TF02-09]|uniref:hypothetical protein n=1 Tax=Blastococcus sp. TF02-09 TaxID=2250576 RepID=UPI0011BD5D46|nr:hypothetical protein [Blastococcus sp. TF02-9]
MRPRGGRRWRAALAAVALALAAGGCTGADDVAGSRTPSPTAAPPSDDGHRTGSFPAPLPHPTDDAASAASALALGTAAVTAFARPDVAPARWWAELAPLLSPAATLAYEGTDPVEVPAHRVTGPAWSGVSPSSFLATVFVPTDAGDYAVLLVREGGGAPWLVERITLVPADYVPPAPATPSPPAGS